MPHPTPADGLHSAVFTFDAVSTITTIEPSIKEERVNPSNRILILLACLLAAIHLPSAIAADEARQAYDKMVEEATQEADEYLEEKQKQMDDAKRQSRVKKDAELQARIQAEQERILKQQHAVQNRGLGPDFTQGMKDNLLQELQQRLNRLNSDPEAYFADQ